MREKVDGDKLDSKEDGGEIPWHMMENGLKIKVGEGEEDSGDGDVGSWLSTLSKDLERGMIR